MTITCVRHCIYENCDGAIDGYFFVAPGVDDDLAWPLSIPYLDEPLPLCHWHAQLIGNQRAPYGADSR
jgi:hypothetical protein